MHRRGNIIWGSILILSAALLLLKQMGYIQGNLFGFIWPLVIIGLGLLLIVGFFAKKAPQAGEKVSLPLEGASSAHIKINHGAGNLRIGSGVQSHEILNGSFGNGLSYKTQVNAGRLEVKLNPSQQFWTWWLGESLDWEISLNQDIPLSLKVDSGASASVLDFQDLKVTDLDIDSGASSTELTLPAAAGSTHVEIDTGASSLKVKVPAGVGADIRIKSGITSITIDPRFIRLDGNHYQSSDYPTAVNRVDLNINAGVGSIEIK